MHWASLTPPLPSPVFWSFVLICVFMCVSVQVRWFKPILYDLKEKVSVAELTGLMRKGAGEGEHLRALCRCVCTGTQVWVWVLDQCLSRWKLLRGLI